MSKGKLAKLFTAATIILLSVLILGISWIGTCGVIYLVTLCFNWTFKWNIATGIWLILLVVGPILKPRVTVKK